MTSQVQIYTKKGEIRELLEINYSESEDVMLHVLQSVQQVGYGLRATLLNNLCGKTPILNCPKHT